MLPNSRHTNVYIYIYIYKPIYQLTTVILMPLLAYILSHEILQINVTNGNKIKTLFLDTVLDTFYRIKQDIKKYWYLHKKKK